MESAVNRILFRYDVYPLQSDQPYPTNVTVKLIHS